MAAPHRASCPPLRPVAKTGRQSLNPVMSPGETGTVTFFVVIVSRRPSRAHSQWLLQAVFHCSPPLDQPADHIGQHGALHDDDDFAAVVGLTGNASERVAMRVSAYCVMPNHFHLVLWPPADWREFVGQVEPATHLDEVCRCGKRGAPFGNPRWVRRTALRLGLESSLRPCGQPRKRLIKVECPLYPGPHPTRPPTRSYDWG